MVEIRADAFAEGEENAPAEKEQKISIDELASLVANKVIEALKAEEKAEEETETETEEQTEEETEEQTEGEPDAEEQTEENAEEQTEGEAEAETEEQTEENRSIDYSAFERRLAEIKK